MFAHPIGAAFPIRVAWLIVSVSACSYDWTVPAEPGAGGRGGGVSAVTAGPSTGGAAATTTSAGGALGGAGGVGGSDDVCTPQGADNACESCVKTQCCTQLQNCTGDVYCDCIRACYANDPTQGCVADCGTPSGPGAALGLCVLPSGPCNVCLSG